MYVKNHYDKNGNVVKTESLRETGVYDISRYEYDSENRPLRSIMLAEQESIYESASLPNTAEITDSEYPDKIMLITGYEHDMLGNRTAVISPEAFGYLETDTANREKYKTGLSKNKTG